MPEGATKTLAQQSLHSQPEVTLYPGDCREVLTAMEAASVHMVLTDPPYFLDGLDDDWRKGNGGRRATGSVGGLPVGMKFEASQGRKLQAFMEPIAGQLFRVLKPGGFALVFSAPRLAHRMAVAFEEAGFEIRDQYVWQFTRRAQFKAFSMDHFIEKRTDMTDGQKREYIKDMAGRKTPQLRPQFESILCAQKPRDGTFVDNWIAHQTGLIDARETLTGNVPATVMTVEKDDRSRGNGHLTPKPVHICEHLIRLFTVEGQTVLDPFLGSGTTCVAACESGRQSIGIDIDPDYIKIARARVKEMTQKEFERRRDDVRLG